MRTKMWMVVAIALLGCGEDHGAGVATGTLAYSDPMGGVAVVNLATGEESHVDVPLGAAGALSLSRDAGKLAFAVEPGDTERHVFVAKLNDDTIYEVQPQTGGFMPEFRWGVGDYIKYWVSLGGVSSQYVALDGAQTARQLGAFDPLASVLSPAAAFIAYGECSQGPITPTCPQHLVVESAAGDVQTLLATGAETVPVDFTPDGLDILSMETTNSTRHLVVRAVDGSGTSQDLGAIDNVPSAFSTDSDDRAAVAPDGSEVLAIRNNQLVALALASGSARTISPMVPDAAAFSPEGDVVFTVSTNLTPGSDTPEYSYALYVSHAGTTIPIVEDARQCNGPPVVSPSGHLVAWICEGDATIYSLSDASILARVSSVLDVLAFDANDAGIVVARENTTSAYDIAYAPVAGAETSLGTAPIATGPIEWPPFDYRP